jgi:succinylarginine dihydrolase
MWAANAATASPSADTADGKVHITPANLASQFRRSLEVTDNAALLRRIFCDPAYFIHHPSLPLAPEFGDEGAANHMRLCREYGEPGLEVFVYGRRAGGKYPRKPKYPPRHSLEASAAIARLHRLDPARVFFVEQNVRALNEGAFHNDVIATGNQSVLFYHEAAYRNWHAIKGKLKRACPGLQLIEVSQRQLPLKEAVDTYIFNSQLISDGQGMVLVAAAGTRRSKRLTRYLKTLVADPRNPITRVEYVDVGQSVKNGGGPACLRLRVVLTDAELQSVTTNGRVLLDDALYAELTAWVERHYRDRIVPMDLCDPNLIVETRAALDQLTQILRLGSVYRFQSEPSRAGANAIHSRHR